MKEKNNLGLIVLIVILIGALILTSCYIVYDKTKAKEECSEISSNNITEKEKVNNIETLEIDSNEVRTLYHNISGALDSLRAINIYYTDKKVTSQDIDNLTAYKIAMLQVYYDKNINIFKNIREVSADEIELKVKETFGKDYKFEHKTYTSCPNFTYDVNNKKYVPNNTPCGTEGGPDNIKRIVKALKKDNNIEIYVRVLFLGDMEENKLVYYEDYNKTKRVEQVNEYYGDTFLESSSLNVAKGSLYKIVFNKEDNNYVFNYSELVK